MRDLNSSLLRTYDSSPKSSIFIAKKFKLHHKRPAYQIFIIISHLRIHVTKSSFSWIHSPKAYSVQQPSTYVHPIITKNIILSDWRHHTNNSVISQGYSKPDFSLFTESTRLDCLNVTSGRQNIWLWPQGYGYPQVVPHYSLCESAALISVYALTAKRATTPLMHGSHKAGISNPQMFT